MKIDEVKCSKKGSKNHLKSFKFSIEREERRVSLTNR